MKSRFVIAWALRILTLVGWPGPVSAQEVTVERRPETSAGWTVNLAFSNDGRELREIQKLKTDDPQNPDALRFLSFEAKTGKFRHMAGLGPGNILRWTTPDGRLAIVDEMVNKDEFSNHVWLVDTTTAKKEAIPPAWFLDNDGEPWVQVSADGKLVSGLSDPEPKFHKLVVTVYDWRTKQVVATNSQDFPAGGFVQAGVTDDGNIDFDNNRSGGAVFDLKTGQRLVEFGSHAHRSPDGRWVVDLSLDDESAAVIKSGETGKIIGHLQIDDIDEDRQFYRWDWAEVGFCGKTGKIVISNQETVLVFQLPSGLPIKQFPTKSWRGADFKGVHPGVAVACSPDGKRVAIRSGQRLTLHDLR